MSTTSAMYDWGADIAKQVAEDRAGISGGGGMTSGGGGSSSGKGYYDVHGQFHAQSESGGGGDGEFPDWLKEPDTSELENEYANTRFNINPFVKPIKNFAEAQFSAGLQTGANAADESIARAFQTGVVGPINTTVLSAQAAMPALLAKMGAKKDIAELRINNMYKEQEARAALAAQIASMRKSYVDTMANFALSKDKMALDAELGRGALDLQRDQFDFSQRQYDDKQQAEGGGSWEEIATIMSAVNATQPGALNFWQRIGGAASAAHLNGPAANISWGL